MRPIIPAKRTTGIRYVIRDLVVLADKIKGKVNYFNIGDPTTSKDFPTPQHLIDAVGKAMAEGKNGYAPSLGVPEAREAIQKDAERRGIGSIHSVGVTYGATEGIEFALTALVNPGENVLTPIP